jgi:Leucine-rich repeat
LAGNRIQELFEIEKLAEMPQLLELSLSQNPVSRKPNYRTVVVKRLLQLLVLDGKEITQEERRRVEGIGIAVDPKQQPLVHFQQFPTVKVPVRLNPVNFEGVFNNMRSQLDSQTPNGPPIMAGQGK